MKESRVLTVAIITMIVLAAMTIIASSCTPGRGGCYATKGMSGYGR